MPRCSLDNVSMPLHSSVFALGKTFPTLGCQINYQVRWHNKIREVKKKLYLPSMRYANDKLSYKYDGFIIHLL